MHDLLDARLRQYREHIMSSRVPALVIRPSRNRARWSVRPMLIAFISLLAVCAGTAGVASHLIPITTLQRELARALGSSIGTPVAVTRFAPVMSSAELRYPQTAEALERLRRVSLVRSVSQSSNGREITVRGSLRGHEYFISASVLIPNTKIDATMTFADTEGKVVHASVPFAGNAFAGILLDVDGMPKLLRSALITAVDKSAKTSF